MALRKLLHLVLREIKNHPRFVLIFVLNASLGILGLMAVEHFKFSFNEVLEQRSKTLLGADLGVRARQGLSTNDLDKIVSRLPGGTLKHQQFSLFSMVKGPNQSRLVSLRGVAPSWPFYGGLRLRNEGAYPRDSGDRGHFLKEGEIWIYPELAMQLDVSIGDELLVGGKSFVVDDIVEEDSQQTFDQGGLAPRIFMKLSDLRELGLVEKGSRFSERWFFKWPTKLSSKETQEIVGEWEALIDDPAVSILSPEKSSENVGRTLNYLNDFLALVSLVALFMACVGLFYLYRSYLNRRREDMAVLCCLGLTKRSIFQLYLLHLFILGLIGTFVAFVLSLAIFPAVSFGLSQVLPFSLPSYSGLRPFILGGAVGLFSQLLLAYALLRPVLNIRPQVVFQTLEDGESVESRWWPLSFVPWLFFYWGLAIYSSSSLVLGSSFVGIFIGVALIIYPLGSRVLSYIEKSKVQLPLKWKLALKTLTRFKFSTLSLFISLVLGSLLLNLVPQIEKNLQDEIEAPADERRLPGLFMFDIQEEQVGPLQNFMSDNDYELRGLSPLIRARLTHINDEPFKRADDEVYTREQQDAQRIRNRGINLTYRAELDESETLIEGKEFDSVYEWGSDDLAQASVEFRYAKRLGIEMGDRLEFDVLGMPVRAKVVGIRKVRWTSFMPNFFIVFQPGVLEDAPKSFLAVSPSLEAQEKVSLQNQLTEKFPNISLIDVAVVIEKIMVVLKQMSWAMQVMALLSIFVGLFVLYSLVQHQMSSRKKDITLLKVLGLSFSDLKSMIIIEFFTLAFTASLIGGIISLGITFIFSHLFFDGIWSFDIVTPALVVFVLTSLCLMISYLGSWKTLKVSPQELLQDAL